MTACRRRLLCACLAAILATPALASPGFLPNDGRWPAPVSHILRAGASTVTCEPGRLVIATGDQTRTLRFAGADPSARLEARRPLPTRYTYLLGNDPSRWRRDVHACAELVYHDLWPGLSLVITADAASLRWDVQTAPGADLAAARVMWDGVPAMAGNVVWPQTSPRHGPSALAWSTFLGGDDTEKALVIRAAADGTLLVAGRTSSVDFPTTPGSLDETFSGDNDAFVARLAADGAELIWCTLIGGTAYEVAGGLAVAADGSVVVTGNTSSLDFPTTTGAYQLAHGGLRDAWVARLAADGADLQWCTYLGGSSVDEGVAVALDGEDRPVVLGNTASADFPTSVGAFDRFANGDWDAFVVRLDAAGETLSYGTYLGGDRYDVAHGLALDAAGRPVIVGQTSSPAFPTTPGAFDRTPNGGDDAFVCTLASSGNALAWSTLLGGTAADAAMGLALDDAGRVLVTGSTSSPDFPTTAGAFSTAFQGATDFFVTCLADDGAVLAWSGMGGGSDQDVARALARDPWGGVVVLGYTRSLDFPVLAGAHDETHNGVLDLFILHLTGDGATLAGSTYLGGASREDGYAVLVQPDGRAIFAGVSESTDFPTTPGALDDTLDGPADAVLFAMDLAPPTISVADNSPLSAMIGAIHPNPCNPSTTITFTLPTAAPTRLTIHDLRGRLITTLVNTDLPPGPHSRHWNGQDDTNRTVPTGIYLCRLTTTNGVATARITVVK